MALIFQHWYLDAIALLVAIFILFSWYLNNNFNYWKKRGIYFIKPKPYFGNFGDTILRKKSIAETISDLYNDFSGHQFGGFFLTRLPALLVRDPDLVRNILVNDFSSFHNRGLFTFLPDHDPLVHHLFNLEGYGWRALRTRLTPTFTSGRMRAMFELVRECSDQLAQAMPLGEVEMKDTCQKYTIDVIGSCAFGLQCNAIKEERNEFGNMAKKIFETSLYANITRFSALLLPELLALFKFKVVPKDVEDFFISVVKNAIQYREANNIVRPDFLNLIRQIQKKGVLEDTVDDKEETKMFSDGTKNMEADYHTGKFELSDNLLAAQCFVFFIAGFETSSTLMSFCLHELAINQHVQDKLHKEIQNVLSKHGGRATYEAIQEMEYLDNVVCETLRKYPPLPMLNRQAMKPYKIPGTDVVLEKGTRIWIPIYGMHHDPEYFPEPHIFDPERFNQENRAKRHHYVYMPFGEGPRNCIGMRFGLLQSKLGLVSILSKFTISKCKRTTSPPVLNPERFLAVQSLGGSWVTVAPRAKM